MKSALDRAGTVTTVSPLEEAVDIGGPRLGEHPASSVHKGSKRRAEKQWRHFQESPVPLSLLAEGSFLVLVLVCL